MPSDKMKKLKKMLPGLKKQVQKRIKEELAKSFRVTPDSKIKSRKKTRKAKRKTKAGPATSCPSSSSWITTSPRSRRTYASWRQRWKVKSPV